MRCSIDRRPSLPLFGALLVLALGCLPVAAAPAGQAVAIRLDRVAQGLEQPVHVTHAGDGSGRLFVVERKGRIRVVRDGAVLPTPFLDLVPMVGSGGSEQGLLSVAFHPRYAENGLFFVDYTDRQGNTVVARYQVSAGDPDRADPAGATPLLGVEQPAANHNGGLVLFGPDGYLYVGLGDGGRAGDPWGNAQNRQALLGKILRLDVDGGSPYAIPPDNPFVDDPAARPEIWAYGLRNPWRFAFDRAGGDLFIADVGQDSWEWVHHQPAGQGGRNYGWNLIEGSHCYPRGQSCDPAAFIPPITEYPHGAECSITGGQVYRGPSYPQLDGLYLFGDFCSGRIWSLRPLESGAWQRRELLRSNLRISSFGEDEAGEVYLTSLGDGSLYRVAAQ